MFGEFDLKFCFVDDLPFLSWQVDSPRKASWFLRKCAESRDPQHRVTLCFSEGDLCMAMQEWANGGVSGGYFEYCVALLSQLQA
jgi:hypothetical protein